MIYNRLGHTDLVVSRLCFGTLTMSPGQKNFDIERGTYLISCALEKGINFFDTAEIYRTYHYLKPVIAQNRRKMVIASKSYAVTADDMKGSLKKALLEMGLEEIDLFLLHEQESELTLKGHWDAWEELCRAKESGLVRAIGLSTHSPRGVLAGANLAELDVIHPLVNMDGIGIIQGNLQEMLSAINKAAEAGKGIYAMKALGGGHLFRRAAEALEFVFAIPGVNAVAVGMQSEEEIEYNCRVAGGLAPPAVEIGKTARRLHIEEWCKGCGACVLKCPQGALKVAEGRVNLAGDCILCGYCALACEDFCLKVI